MIIDLICLKCLDKDPKRRYGSGEALAADLERWRKGEPILARPITFPQRAWLWCKRNRLLASMMGTAALGVLAAFAVLIVSNILISKQAEIVEEARTRENSQRLEAEASADEANRQKEIAEVRRRQAEKAVDRLLTRVARRLPGVPGLSGLRLTLFQDALEVNEEFAREKGDDPGVRLRVAESHLRVGLLQRLLGRKEAAEKATQQATAIFEQLVADFPSQAIYLHEWGASLIQNAAILRENGNWQEARQMYQQVLELVEKHEGPAPQNNSSLALLASAHANLGELLSNEGQFPAAEERYRLALSLRRQFLQKMPGERGNRNDMANLFYNLADVLDDLKRTKEAATFWQDARAEHKNARPMLDGRWNC